MIFLHQSSCISPQQTYVDVDLENLHTNFEAWLNVIEPRLDSIPRGVLRRMGKAVRLGVGTALPLINQNQIDAIILGTANGGMEDCIKFLNQIIEYEEGSLTPTNFVQSTTNAIAGQLGLLAKNTGYNATHVHRGTAFENALMDAAFFAKENPTKNILVGGIDEISNYNYHIDYLAGWYKKARIINSELFQSNSEGSIAGEGAAMFIANANPEGAILKVERIQTIHTRDFGVLRKATKDLLRDFNVQNLLSGENGDVRLNAIYQLIEDSLERETAVFRYKHLCGEYQTSSSFALWLIMQAFAQKELPKFLDIKRNGNNSIDGQWLIYNAYQGFQHSFMVVSPA